MVEKKMEDLKLKIRNIKARATPIVIFLGATNNNLEKSLENCWQTQGIPKWQYFAVHTAHARHSVS